MSPARAWSKNVGPRERWARAALGLALLLLALALPGGAAAWLLALLGLALLATAWLRL